jgi:hypothetical protein
MDARTAPDRAPSPEVIEFVRFCYRRRRVGWPDLYDEMCAVAGRGLFRGWRNEELAARGIGFGLFELPSLAAVASRVIAEEQQRRAAPSRGEEGRAGLPAEADAAGDRSEDPAEAVRPARLVYAGAG